MMTSRLCHQLSPHPFAIYKSTKLSIHFHFTLTSHFHLGLIGVAHREWEGWRSPVAASGRESPASVWVDTGTGWSCWPGSCVFRPGSDGFLPSTSTLPPSCLPGAAGSPASAVLGTDSPRFPRPDNFCFSITLLSWAGQLRQLVARSTRACRTSPRTSRVPSSPLGRARQREQGMSSCWCYCCLAVTSTNNKY